MFSLNDLIKLTEKDCTEAMVVLGSYFYNGTNGVSIDRKKSFEYLKRAADLYDPNAQVLISEFYKNGVEVAKDIAKFEEYCINSINQGNLIAKCKLAVFYEENQKYEEAAKLISDPKFQNSPIGAAHLAIDSYRAGDYDTAFKALERFYRDDTQLTLLRSYCLFKGRGTKSHPEEAIKMLNKIKGEVPPAALYLVGEYEASLGNTMLKNHDEASLMYMEEAAEKDFAPAVFQVGKRYRDGIGIEANEEKSHEYFAKATSLGYKFEKEYDPFMEDSFCAQFNMEFSNTLAELAKESLDILQKRAAAINPNLSETEKLVIASIGSAAASIIYGSK